MTRPFRSGTAALAVAYLCLSSSLVLGQERLPWQSGGGQQRYDEYRPDAGPREEPRYDAPRRGSPAPTDVYRPSERPQSADSYRADDGAGRGDAYRPPVTGGPSPVDSYRSGGGYRDTGPEYGRPYSPGPDTAANDRYDDPPPTGPRDREQRLDDRTYSQGEISEAGHRFFGSVSQGLASAVESLFKSVGRPNGYILGEDAGGAFVAGLRYGEGTLFTKSAGNHKVYWQGPTIGYDFGGEGSKVMVLVYNLRDPAEIYERFGGVQGSAYLVGGVSVQLQKRDEITLAPIRAGVGVRLGANVGYLKYTRSPTWNPF